MRNKHSEYKYINSIINPAWYALDLLECDKETSLQVLSIHEAVINFKVEGWPHLLMLASPHLPGGPACIGLNSEDFGVCIRIARNPGAGGAFQQGLIVLTGGGETVRIPYQQGRPLFFGLPDKLEDSLAGRREALSVYRRELALSGVPSASAVLLGLEGGEDFFRQGIADSFPQFARALLTDKKKDLESSCRNLIGLGRGSTPTGDDLLFSAVTTYRYYLRATKGSYLEAGFLAGHQGRTTLMGLHMLEMGRRGLAPDPLRDFLSSIFTGRPDREILCGLTQRGASTGYDMAAAAIYTVEVLDRVK